MFTQTKPADRSADESAADTSTGSATVGGSSLSLPIPTVSTGPTDEVRLYELSGYGNIAQPSSTCLL